MLEDLTRAWHFQREAVFRRNQKTHWINDSYRLVLRRQDAPIGNQVDRICNRATAFYWLPATQTGAPDAEKTFTPGIIFAALFEEWSRCCVHLNIEFGHFLATPVRVAATGPSTLPDIVKAHMSIYAQAQQLSGLEHYSVHPLFPAIILVCDQFDGKVSAQPDGYVSLRDVAKKQSVLVVLTGSRAGSGADGTTHGLEISLDSLAPFALPLEWAACGVDVVRVPLSEAVRFVTELEERVQDQQVPSLDRSLCGHDYPLGYNPNVRYSPDLWAHAVQAAGEENGYESMDARESVLRVRARLEGQKADCEFEHEPFSIRWKQ